MTKFRMPHQYFLYCWLCSFAVPAPGRARFAQLPGNWGMRPREAFITSKNFVSLCPFHNFERGKRSGNPWGEAVALFKTHSHQPFYFNFHTTPKYQDSTDAKAPGNTVIFGATGVGKTTLENALLAFAMKYHGLRVIIFDKDRGAEILVRALNGKYRALEKGVPTGFNPFQAELTENNMLFCERLLKKLVQVQNARLLIAPLPPAPIHQFTPRFINYT